MAAQVEANSLSDITHIASNPPKYPRNPTEKKRDPLTLYIARVPGTRDIILTTLKPQLKNVTASDVANSLYYLHLNTEEDARLLEAEQNVRSDSESITSIQKPLPRKPLPDSARSSLEINRQGAPPLLKIDSNTSLTTRRKPVPSSDSPTKPTDLTASKPPLSRRPLGPRPQQSTSHVERKPLSAPSHDVEDVRSISSRDISPVRPHLEIETPLSATRSLQSPSEHEKRDAAFNVTIIRRDPSTASQWNIGTVTGHPVRDSNDRPKTSPHQSKKTFFDMSVHLTNPGYIPFKHSYLTSQMEKANANPTSLNQGSRFARGRNEEQKSVPGFQRSIRMEGTDFWTRSFGQHKRTKSDMAVRPGIVRGRSFSGSADIEPPTPQANPNPTNFDNTAKGYMFLSPWHGRCKFQTSSSGRSLRCRHTLQDPVPLGNDLDGSQKEHTSMLVSEIRFNLPSAAIFNSVAESFSKKGEGDSHRFSIPAFDHIRTKLSSHKSPPPQPPRPSHNSYTTRDFNDDELAPPLPRRPNRQSFTESSEDDTLNGTKRGQYRTSYEPKGLEDRDSHFDLSLGQEKAGGGNRGKRAKLGKLIIHDEGFKFLDLLVASNMAVWWSVWEPEF